MDTAVADAYRDRIGRVGVWLGAVLSRAGAAEERAAAAEIEELG